MVFPIFPETDEAPITAIDDGANRLSKLSPAFSPNPKKGNRFFRTQQKSKKM